MVDIYTGHMTYSGYDRMDITVKTGEGIGEIFAPTWGMVQEYRKTGNKSEYSRKYLSLMLGRGDKFINALEYVIKLPSITFVCYCNPGRFCHRVLLAELIVYLYPEFNVRYIGEKR